MKFKWCGDAGLMFFKNANISDTVRDKITEIVKKQRGYPRSDGKRLTRVVIHNGYSRREEFTCCDVGMVVVDVYLSQNGNSRREYKTNNPSFVCTECFSYKGPESYADWGFA